MERNVLSGLSALAVGAVVLGMGAAVQAAPIAVVNPSFELPEIDTQGIQLIRTVGDTGGDQVPGWNRDGTGYAYVAPANNDLAGEQDQNQYAEFDARASTCVIWQVLPTLVDSAKSYALTVKVGAFGSPYPSPGYNIALVRADNGNTLAEIKSTDIGAPAVPSTAGMVDVTLNYTPLAADNGAPFKIEIGDLTTGTNYYGAFDDVRFSDNSPTPEPASVALLGLGAGALLMRRRRRLACL